MERRTFCPIKENLIVRIVKHRYNNKNIQYTWVSLHYLTFYHNEILNKYHESIICLAILYWNIRNMFYTEKWKSSRRTFKIYNPYSNSKGMKWQSIVRFKYKLARDMIRTRDTSARSRTKRRKPRNCSHYETLRSFIKVIIPQPSS